MRAGDSNVLTEHVFTLQGRLRVSAAEGVRAAVLAHAGIAVASEWMFSPEIADRTVQMVLQDWELPRIDLWAVFPAGRTATTKARTFTQFASALTGVKKLIKFPSGSRNSKERFPHGWVVGRCTNSLITLSSF